MIPYGRQSLDEDDVEAVVSVLRGDWLTQGPTIEKFESALTEATGAKYAVAFSSGTAALHGAADAGALGPGDTVATSPLSFAASAACASYVGARPTFVDIDPDTLNMSLSDLPDDCDGLIAVHYAGLPVDLRELPYRPRVVIEDAAHALGAVGPDGTVGNCARSDMTVFSFHPVKAVTTGEGGAVTTNDVRFAERLRRFRTHGIIAKPDHGGWYYEIERRGFNYRLTDIQAALGVSQLTKLERFVERRNALAAGYREKLVDMPIVLPSEAPDRWRHAYHLFPVQVPERRAVYDRLRQDGIGVQVHYIPIYRHPAYRDRTASPGDFPHTERAYSRLLSLPMFPTLSDGEQDTVVEALHRAIQ